MDLTSLDDVTLLTLCAWGEARGEPVEGQLGVMNCIRNRVEDAKKRFGKSYPEVILKPYQFSCFNLRDPNRLKIEALAERFKDALASLEQPVTQLWYLASGVLGRQLQDNIKGANHYFVSGTPVPAWAQGHSAVAHIGLHAFYIL